MHFTIEASVSQKKASNDFNMYLKVSGNKDGDAEQVRKWIRDLGFEPEY